MIERKISTHIIEAFSEYPIITIIGPRQSGKTTLAKALFPDLPYINLEDPTMRMAMKNDPKGVLSSYGNCGVIDEVQRVPELLSYLQVITDEIDMPGQFVLTGSHQPKLQESISQSLAGRTAIFTLLPFSCEETADINEKLTAFDFILKGGYPRLYSRSMNISRFYDGYIQTYLERDVRMMIKTVDLLQFQKFMMLLAGRVGQIVNYSSLANDVGVSSTTIKKWISILSASFVVYELPAYYKNIRKRIVKSPKVYFYDTGVLCHLLKITSSSQLLRDPLRGNIYENAVINEVVKYIRNRDKRSSCYFYRDTNGNEVDLLVEKGRRLHAVEIKSSETYAPSFLKGLQRFKSIISPDIWSGGSVIYNGSDMFVQDGIDISNLFSKFQKTIKTIV